MRSKKRIVIYGTLGNKKGYECPSCYAEVKLRGPCGACGQKMHQCVAQAFPDRYVVGSRQQHFQEMI